MPCLHPGSQRRAKSASSRIYVKNDDSNLNNPLPLWHRDFMCAALSANDYDSECCYLLRCPVPWRRHSALGVGDLHLLSTLPDRTHQKWRISWWVYPYLSTR
jgi:hypothetical protein